jgi:selenocysteine-specific elongation factor
MASALRTHHAAQPDQVGLTMVRLRLAVPVRVPVPVFSAVLVHLQKRNELKITGSWVHLPDHVPQLSPVHDALWARIKPLLSGEARFRPPRVQEMAEHLQCRAETIRGLCKRLARRGDVQEIVTDQFLLSSVVAELANLAVQTAADIPSGLFSAADFRDRIGIGRKMAILVLEYFDKECFTIRKGDLRRIDPYRKGMYVTSGTSMEGPQSSALKPHQSSSTQNL